MSRGAKCKGLVSRLCAGRLLQGMKIENVEKVMDDINDSSEQMREINDAMAIPLGGARDIDETELEEELEEMEVSPACGSLGNLQPWSLIYLVAQNFS